MPNKTNSINAKFSSASGKTPPRLGARMGHGNPDKMGHMERRGSKGMSKSGGAGLQGLSVGKAVPMKMFEQNYKGKNLAGAESVTQGMATQISGNKIAKATKRASKKSNKFMGLGGAGGEL